MDRNIYEVEVDGKKIGFKCGTLAIAIACREANVKSFQELLIAISKGDLLAILGLFYGSYCQYNHVKAPEFTPDHMSDLMEDIGVEKSGEIIQKLINVFLPKNQQAPQEGASPETQ